MTPDQKSAFILSQIAMMTAEREVMLAEDREAQSKHGEAFAHVHSSLTWEKFRARWESVLGYNAVITLFRE